MFCVKCGQENKEGAQYCEYCGAKLIDPNELANSRVNNIEQRKITSESLSEKQINDYSKDLKTQKKEMITQARNSQKSLIIFIVAFVAVLGIVGAIGAILHNKNKETPVPEAEKTTTESASVTEESVTTEKAVIDTATATTAASTDDSLLLVSAKEKADEIGYAATGQFSGRAIETSINDFKYWESVDFGYETRGLLSSQLFTDNGTQMLLTFYLNSSQNICMALYSMDGGNVKKLYDNELSYKTEYSEKTYTISNDLVKGFGTEGKLSAMLLQKDNKSYIITENNAWFTNHSDDSSNYSDIERGISAESLNSGSFCIYEVSSDGINMINAINLNAYGYDGNGSISSYDIKSGKDNYIGNYGDLEGSIPLEEGFMNDYNAYMSEIGFPELTNTDIVPLCDVGVIGDKALWSVKWDCNTNMNKGDNTVSLEVTDFTSKSDFPWWREGITESGTAKAENATGTDAVQNSDEESAAIYRDFLIDMKDTASSEENVWYYGPGIIEDYATEQDLKGILIDEMTADSTYTYMDIDRDGTDELIIGYGTEGTAFSNYINAVVTKTKDGYKIVANGWVRNSLSYVGDGIFYNTGSGGAALHYDAIYEYDGSEKDLVKYAELVTQYDDSSDELVPVYSLYADGWTWNNEYDYKDDPNAWHGDEAKDKWDEYYNALDEDNNPFEGYTWYKLSDLK